MELRGERVVLRTPADEEAAIIAASVRASLTELEQWMPWATAEYDTADALRWVRGETGDVHRFVMIDPVDGAIVGSCGLNRVDALHLTANLGYWVRSDRTGHGVATEATRLLARFGLAEAGLARLEITMSTRNHASRRVAEKAGATYEGVRRNALLLLGERHDAHVWSVVGDDLPFIAGS